ncbi:spore coat protein [Clostridium chromiireducens]|uniref:Spore coat protein n=1 Tax=Clostridium chromiireducens TaxID=225345 RepID=A0A964RMJ0_9CLOT|nr:spore coat protein [Clostridium chromiireducens]MVX64322.1 spore coat protein [Clostridium chromiireducens]
MYQDVIAPNESMQLHEILIFKNLCLTKALAMSPLAVDDELKSILQQDIRTSEKHIKELRGLMEKSNCAPSENIES